MRTDTWRNEREILTLSLSKHGAAGHRSRTDNGSCPENRRIDYDGRAFRSLENTANGDVGEGTLFRYRQDGDLVWAEYAGGGVRRGHLIGKVAANGDLDFRYHHLAEDGRLMTGECRSSLTILPDGRYRLAESWRWTCGDGSSGHSIVEEVPL